MAYSKNLSFTFSHASQPDEVFGIMTTTQLKQNFDSRGDELKNYIYGLVDYIDDLETQIKTMKADIELLKSK